MYILNKNLQLLKVRLKGKNRETFENMQNNDKDCAATLTTKSCVNYRGLIMVYSLKRHNIPLITTIFINVVILVTSWRF